MCRAPARRLQSGPEDGAGRLWIQADLELRQSTGAAIRKRHRCAEHMREGGGAAVGCFALDFDCVGQWVLRVWVRNPWLHSQSKNFGNSA